MTKPSSFILNPDYATLKNDNKGTVTLSITDSGIIPFGSLKVYESFLDIGTINAGLRCQVSTSLSSNIWSSFSIIATVTVTVYSGGTPVDTFSYRLPVIIERISTTRIRIYANFYSYGADVSMRITGGYQTITADIITFLSPFN